VFSFLRRCKHLTARITADRRAAVDRYCLPAGPTVANPPHAATAAQDGTDRQTDGHRIHYIDPASSVNNYAINHGRSRLSCRYVNMTVSKSRLGRHQLRRR